MKSALAYALPVIHEIVTNGILLWAQLIDFSRQTEENLPINGSMFASVSS